MQLSGADTSVRTHRPPPPLKVRRTFDYAIQLAGLSGAERSVLGVMTNRLYYDGEDGAALNVRYFIRGTGLAERTIRKAITGLIDRGIFQVLGRHRYAIEMHPDNWGRPVPIPAQTCRTTFGTKLPKQVSPPAPPIRNKQDTRSNDPTNHPPTPQTEDRVVEVEDHVSSNPFRPVPDSGRNTKPPHPVAMPDVPPLPQHAADPLPDTERMRLVIRDDAMPQNITALTDATAALEAAYGKESVRDALLEARERSASDPVRYARGILRRDPLFRRTSGERTNFNTLAASPGSDGAKRVVRAFMEAMKLPFLDETVDASLRYAEKVISDLLAASTDVPDREAAVALAEHCAAVVPNFPARTMIVDRMELFERHLAKFYKLARNRHDAAQAFATNPATMNDADAAQFALRAKLAAQLRANKPR